MSNLRSAVRAIRTYVVMAVIAFPSSAFAATYQVGPARAHTNMAALPTLQPGDLVEVDGDATYPPFEIRVSGVQGSPITVRGIPLAGKRPVFSGGSDTISVGRNGTGGDWIVLESIEVTGGSNACIRHAGDNDVLRDVLIHHCNMGILGHDNYAGNLTVEYSEVHHCGSGTQSHQIYVTTAQDLHPGSRFRLQHSYLHEGNGGNNVKSRSERNEIHYNWIEGAVYHLVELIGPDITDDVAHAREDSDVVGNVLRTGTPAASGGTAHITRMGGDDPDNPFKSTNGRYRFVNNTVIVNSQTATVFRLFLGIESVEMHNNVFFAEGGGTSARLVSEDQIQWVSGRILRGFDNWVDSRLQNIPGNTEWTGTITGNSPGFVSASALDFRPAAGSALVDSGRDAPPTISGHEFPQPLWPPVLLPPERAGEAPGAARVRPTGGAIDIGAYEIGSSLPPPDAGSPRADGGSGADAGGAHDGRLDSGAAGTDGGGTNGAAGSDAVGGCGCGLVGGGGSTSAVSVAIGIFALAFARRRGQRAGSRSAIFALALSTVAGCGGPSRAAPDAGGASSGSSGGIGDFLGDGGSTGTSGAPCTGLGCNVHACPNGRDTTLSGTVYDPAGRNPLYNVVVYVPNAALEPFADHATCDTCGALYTGKPIAAAITGTDGKFVVKHVPDGQNIPVVVQIGKWRKQIEVPNVARCTDTAIPRAQTTLPSKHGPNDDMPKIAVSTGAWDSIECLLRRLGIDDSEFTAGGSGDQRVHVFRGYDEHGSPNGPSMPSAPLSGDALWASSDALRAFDMVVLSCEGAENPDSKPPAALSALQEYIYSGGRVFATHFHYYWFSSNPTFAPTAQWTMGPQNIGDIEGDINTSFPKGADFKAWLRTVGALDPSGRIPIQQARHNADILSGNTVSEPWIFTQGSLTATEYFTFNAPLGTAPEAQCGRVVYSDLHVGGASNDYGGDPHGQSFPSGCTRGDLSAQEKALEFMLFDLSSCVTPDSEAPQPPDTGIR